MYVCFLVSLMLQELHPYSYSPVCPHEAILELKGGRAGKVVKCQVPIPPEMKVGSLGLS